jgi:hypothetical protein
VKKALAVAVLAVTALCALVVTGGAAGGASISQDLRFDVITTRDGRTLLWRDGKRRGELLEAPRRVGRRGGAVALDAAVLHRGRIFFAMATRDSYDENTSVAVVGGTGAYALVEGTGVLDYSGTRNILTLALRR